MEFSSRNAERWWSAKPGNSCQNPISPSLWMLLEAAVSQSAWRAPLSPRWHGDLSSPRLEQSDAKARKDFQGKGF